LPNGHVHCRIINTASQYITVFRNTPLGVTTPLPHKMTADICVTNAFSDLDLNKATPVFENPIKNIDLSKSALNTIERKKLLTFLETKSEVFATHPYDLGKIKLKTDRVCDTGDARPIRKRAYRMPVSQREILDSEISKMLEAGLIEEAPQSLFHYHTKIQYGKCLLIKVYSLRLIFKKHIGN